jgi:hypothetical protein
MYQCICHVWRMLGGCLLRDCLMIWPRHNVISWTALSNSGTAEMLGQWQKTMKYSKNCNQGGTECFTFMMAAHVSQCCYSMCTSWTTYVWWCSSIRYHEMGTPLPCPTCCESQNYEFQALLKCAEGTSMGRYPVCNGSCMSFQVVHRVIQGAAFTL